MISIALRDYRKDEMISKSTFEKTTPIYNISLKLSHFRSLSPNIYKILTDVPSQGFVSPRHNLQWRPKWKILERSKVFWRVRNTDVQFRD